MNSEPFSVIVIGGGIAGIATAMYLAQGNVNVVCIEANDEIAQETSFMNGSLACASLTQPWCSRSNLTGFLAQVFKPSPADGSIVVKWSEVWNDVEFWKWVINFTCSALSQKTYRELFISSYRLSSYSLKCMEEFESAPGWVSQDSLYKFKGLAKGTIQLFPSFEEQSRQYLALFPVVSNLQLISANAVSELNPVLNQPELFPGGAIVSVADRSYNIHNLCVAMKRNAVKNGAKFITNQHVKKLVQSNKSTVDHVVLEGGGPLPADVVVVATGNHSNGFAEWAGDGWHSWPVRGFALEVPIADNSKDDGERGSHRTHKRNRSKTVSSVASLQYNVVDDPRRIYIAPITPGKVRLSGFCELGARYPDKTKSVDFAPAGLLLEQARQLLPSGYLADSQDPGILHHTCWRPQTPDDLPVVGRSGKYANLYYNTGHGHLGLTRAVGSAKLLSELIIHGEVAPGTGLDMEDYRPDRFGVAGSLLRLLGKALR